MWIANARRAMFCFIGSGFPRGLLAPKIKISPFSSLPPSLLLSVSSRLRPPYKQTSNAPSFLHHLAGLVTQPDVGGIEAEVPRRPRKPVAASAASGDGGARLDDGPLGLMATAIDIADESNDLQGDSQSIHSSGAMQVEPVKRDVVASAEKV